MISSLYLHIPFCHTKCQYCSFSSWQGRDNLHLPYVASLKKEIERTAQSTRDWVHLKTIFFGGGTPTVLEPQYLAEILGLCKSLFPCEKDMEISFEANPGTINLKKLESLRVAGFNRISVGVQSFISDELRILGRSHTPQQAVDGIEMASAAGFENISLDLMYGLCGQDIESWKESLDTALNLNPNHLSMYQLTIEEGTPMAERVAQGILHLPDDEVIVAIDELNITECEKAGLAMYEISNYAQPGHECLHNINYWRNESYLAVGAGAVSYIDGKRERRYADPAEYCLKIDSGSNHIVESEELGLEESFRESVIMGLRMTEGVSIPRLSARYSIDIVEYYGEILKNLVRKGLVELAGEYLRLTPAGRIYSNIILAELV